MKERIVSSSGAIVFVLLFQFSNALHSATLTALFSFSGTNGASPRSRLEIGNDGKLYGTTASGGSGNGTIFRISTSGQFELLYSFAGHPDGQEPYAGLTLGRDGNYYGTTYYGGSAGLGSIYKMTPNGRVNIIESLVDDGTNGYETFAPLCQGTDGSFYGTTFYGGAIGYGTVFRIQTNGALTTLYSFPTTTNDTFSPNAGLVQGLDGLLYGTTYGDVGDDGRIFKISTNGTATSFFSFAGTNGAHPRAELVFGSDGNLYGTTSGLLGSGNGTVFRVTTNGVLNTLVAFAVTNGANPEAPLILANDGDLYGTTVNGGPESGMGTVFRIQKDGTLVTLFSFHGTNGANPYAGLVQGPNGNFYGSTASGGVSNYGTIFRLSLKPSIQSQTITKGQFQFSWDADIGASYQIQYATNLSQGYWSNLFSTVQATNTSMNSVDTNASDTSRFYRIMLLP